LAKTIPSSAGFVYNAAGEIEVFVRDSMERGNAASALTSLASSKRIHLRADHHQHTPHIIVKPADFTFQELAAWRDAVGDYVDSTAGIGVVSLDLDEGRNRLTLGVRASANRQQLLSAFVALGVDSKAINFEPATGFKNLSSLPTPLDALSRSPMAAMFTSLSIQDNAPQLIGGLEIGIDNPNFPRRAQCTLGFAAQENQNGASTLGFLTASHCTQNLFAHDGNAFYQSYSGAYVGSEKDDPQGYRCGIYICNVADATFIQASAPQNVGLGLIAKATSYPGTFTYDPSNLWVVTQVEHNDLYVNEQVQWVGSTSGFQLAVISNTCVDFWHDYDFPSASEYKTTCEDETTGSNAQGGDSGGTVYVVLGDGNEVEAAGMISGDYLNTQNLICFTRVTRIQADFNTENGQILFYPVATGPTLTLNDNGLTDGNGHPSLTWNAYPGALNYDVYSTTIDASCNQTSGPSLIYSTTATSYVDMSVVSSGFTLCPAVGYYVTVTTSNSFQQSNTASYGTQ